MPAWVAILALGVVAIMVIAPGPARQAESIGVFVFAPLEIGLSRAVASITRLLGTIQQAGDLAEQNRRYQEEIDRLETSLIRLHELELENHDLRQMLGLRDVAPPGSLLSANVVARDPLALLNAVTIDRGAADGVAVNQAVVTWRGVVGRVVEVHANAAKVLLITDVNSAVSARIQDPNSRATGTLRGIGDGRLLLQYVPRADKLQTGDVVITSGIGGVFPAGLVMGRVVQVRQKDIEAFQEALVEPAVDVRNLERLYVFVRAAPSADATGNAITNPDTGTQGTGRE
jgi:rod shape-determining protein MreC